jgi:23S rRNA (pseudouridine1915-N3)-methyltransferase
MRYEILFLGKTKESFLTEGINEYFQRINHYARVSVKTVKTRKQCGSDECIKDKEGELLIANMDPLTCVVALDPQGVQYSSVGFSALVGRWEQAGIKHVTFVIGGPLGLSSTVLKKADWKISLSQMTFTHDMVRLFLLEQLYRAYTIKAGEKYHK